MKPNLSDHYAIALTAAVDIDTDRRKFKFRNFSLQNKSNFLINMHNELETFAAPNNVDDYAYSLTCGILNVHTQ